MVIELKQDRDVCVLGIRGRLATGSNEADLQAVASEVRRMDCGKLLVDLSELTSLGSSGISFLLDLYTSVTGKPDGSVVLIGPSRHVREVLDLTRVSTVIPIAADRAAGRIFLSSGGKGVASNS